MLFITACSESGIVENTSSNVKEYIDGSYTLLIYMCGSSLETKNGAATKNITEMLGVDLPENTNVVIQTGGAKEWRKYDIPSDKSNRYIIKDKKLSLVESNPIADMGSSDTLLSFLSFGIKNYPAENTGLIFWNHGGGSAVGVCNDELCKNSILTLNEISSAMESLNLKKKFAFVGFDACLMANYETACMLAPFADKMVASEELEPAAGWDYTTLLNNLDDLTAALNGYAKKNSKFDYYTMSIIDLTKIDKIKKLFSQVIESVPSDKKYLIARATFHSSQFGSKTSKEGGSDLYDLGGVAEYLGIDYDLSDCVSYRNGSARTQATGLSFYFPISNRNQFDNYVNNIAEPDYASFLTNYFADGESSKITFTDYGKIDGNKMTFSVSPESADIVCSVQYLVYRVSSTELLNNRYKLWELGSDTDVIENNNSYTVDFVGNWVFLNGYQLNCQVVDEFIDYTLYSSIIKINNEVCSLNFTYDKTTHKLHMSGYTEQNEKNGRLSELKDGDKITILYNEFESDLSSKHLTEGESFTYSAENMPLTVEMLPDDYYMYRTVTTDIYGNQYLSNFAVMHLEKGVAKIIEIVDMHN